MRAGPLTVEALRRIQERARVHPQEPWAPRPWRIEPDGEEVRIVDRDGKVIGWLNCVRGTWPGSAALIVRAVNKQVSA